MDAPLPASTDPHAPVYHFQLALLPRLPPDTRKVVLLPAHTESRDAVMLLADTDSVFTLMNLLAQEVVLQVPSART
jgi:hypothetical protein